MKRFIAAVAVAALLAGCDDDSGPIAPSTEGVVSVMTRNIYVGADLDLILAAQSLADVPILAAEAWQGVLATNFSERAAVLADELATTKPHVVGLQEVSLIRIQSPGDFLGGNPTLASEVALDQLAVLLNALDARGLSYTAVAKSTGFDIEIPMATATGLDDIRLTDHEVILARSDVQIANILEQNFTTNLVVPIGGPGGPTVTVLRGWVSVDATIDGKTFRFVSTHLEPPEIAPQVQIAQTEELMQQLSGTNLPIVFVGDFNSAADGSSTATYSNLIAAGFTDVWTQGASTGAGLTCCQEDLLRNAASILIKRIDLILVRGGFDFLDAALVGADPAERTASGLWPSDHAGVTATLRVR